MAKQLPGITSCDWAASTALARSERRQHEAIARNRKLKNEHPTPTHARK